MKRTRRPGDPPHLRLITSSVDVDHRNDDYDVGAVVEAVVRNLMNDARTVTAAATAVIANLFVVHGVDRRAADAPAIRDAILRAVTGVFQHRLIIGLQDEDPDDAVRVDEPPPVGGLMQRFRETLASEE